jgi:tRNA U34 5-methylaminomethyl-2-thiouridine-forming methyltransferase MnmC
MRKEFLITEDGSHTIYLPEMDEHYHSIHGAIQESEHIYIGQGFLKAKANPISILEIGFGTGLNAYLTYCYSLERNISVNYTSLEKYPLTEAEYCQLNYPTSIFPENAAVFEKIHYSDWGIFQTISPDFRLLKLQVDLLTHEFDELPQYDLVYYDAFAPGKQPEMWTDEILQKVASTVKINGILITYCAKGTVRRTLSSAGFMMERIQGPVGKKEILRGKKTF